MQEPALLAPLLAEASLYAAPRSFHSAVKSTTSLHRNYFGDRDFAKRVYEAQLTHTTSVLVAHKVKSEVMRRKALRLQVANEPQRFTLGALQDIRRAIGGES